MTELTHMQAPERVIEIVKPGTNDKIGLRITLIHIDDERFEKLKRNITDRRLYLEARGKTFKASDIEENRINILFTGMIGWEWYNPTGAEGDKDYSPSAAPTFEGDASPTFNLPTVTKVLNRIKWIADQVNDGVGDTKAFF